MIAPPSRALAAKAAGLFVACFLVSICTVPLIHSESGIAPFWPANAVALVFMLRAPAGTWPYFLAAAFLAELSLALAFAEPLASAATFATADTLDVAVAFALVRPWAKEIGGSLRLTDFLRFLALAAFVAPASGALLAASVEVVEFGGSFLEGLVRWWASGAVGMALFAPFCLELTANRLRMWRESVLPWELAVLAVATMGLVTVVFTQPHFFMLFLVMPFLLWSALRAGRLGVSALTILIVLPAVGFTLQGMGPVATLYPGVSKDQIIFLQVFLVSLAIPALIIATVYGERLRTETALNQAVRRLRAAQTLSGLLHWERSLDESEVQVPEGQMAVIVDDLDCLRGQTPAEFLQRFVHPEDRDKLRAALSSLSGAERHYDLEYRFIRPDGEERMVREIGQRDARTGKLIGTLQDVTEKHETERVLMQAQKMEAVGQLTGGIAHDFNNLLTIIIGNLELAERLVREDGKLKTAVSKAINAADRGAALIGRLLAFSRKQPLRPQPVDAAGLARSMTDLLHRSLGETVEIALVEGEGLWPCLADPSQLENAFMNLAINARDAMSAGGTLTIDTANVMVGADDAPAESDLPPGAYVRIAFRDTGKGMAADEIERAFDPFFTTKETGKGTGLGLSMVYGFAKQSNGHVGITSEIGEGTTVELYLPRAAAQPAAPAPSPLPVEQAPPGRNGETILVVEDDEGLRQMTTEMLSDLGYGLHQAGTGQHAVGLLESALPLDLLLVDVVLPGGMSGVDIADSARKLRPDLPILFMSGYSDDAIIHHGRLDAGVRLLEKPFRKAELAAAVRKALDAPA